MISINTGDHCEMSWIRLLFLSKYPI